MRILLIGFIAFVCWSSLSTYIYVCKIRGLCNEPEISQMAVVDQKDIVVADAVPKPLVREDAVIPENLIIYFAFDRSDFKTDSETDRYFNESTLFLDKNLQARLSITGHTDATGSDKYNQALGYRRAQSTKRYFESKGMPSNRIIIESKGENAPADDNNTKEGRAKNRRTEITINK